MSDWRKQFTIGQVVKVLHPHAYGTVTNLDMSDGRMEITFWDFDNGDIWSWNYEKGDVSPLNKIQIGKRQGLRK